MPLHKAPEHGNDRGNPDKIRNYISDQIVVRQWKRVKTEENGKKKFVTRIVELSAKMNLCCIVYSTNHVYLHRPNAFGFWQTRLHLCYKTLKRISN